MHHSPARRLLVSVVVPMVVAGALVATGQISASAAGCLWKVQPSPNVGNGPNSVASIAATSSTNAWAVGFYSQGGDLGALKTLIQHWNGQVWSVQTSPNVGNGNNILYGVAATSASNAWAVGSAVNGNVQQTLIEHWDGKAWSVQSSPNVGNQGNNLLGVVATSATNAWAVGYFSDGGQQQTLVLHWNGKVWSVQSSPNVGSFANVLYSVTAVSSTNAWAAGYYSNGTSYRTLILHWNGSSWKVQTSPNVGPWNNVLYGAGAASGTNAWAASHYFDAGTNTDKTLVLHWTGTAWKVQPSPNVGTNNSYLQGVRAISATNVWSVGYFKATTYRTLIEHWNGNVWRIIPSPNMGDGFNALYGVGADTTGDVWAVGEWLNSSGAYQTLIMHWCEH